MLLSDETVDAFTHAWKCIAVRNDFDRTDRLKNAVDTLHLKFGIISAELPKQCGDDWQVIKATWHDDQIERFIDACTEMEQACIERAILRIDRHLQSSVGCRALPLS